MSPQIELSIEYVPVDEVVPAIRNPKAHDVDELRAAIRRFGYVEPIMRDDRTGRLIAGHGRTEQVAEFAAAAAAAVAADAGLVVEAPRGIQLDADGRWLLPMVVGWSSRDDAEAEAYIIAANRLPERGGWHEGLLAEMLAELDGEVGLAGVGYESDDVDGLLAGLPDAADLLGDDEPPPPGGEPEPRREPITGVDSVRFAFGDYTGLVTRSVYDRFVESYEQQRIDTGEVMLDDVLLIWLGIV